MNEESICANWNGEDTFLHELKVPVMDRAFFFGDAVYEVIRIYDGKLWLLKEHMERLKRSLDLLKIKSDENRFEERLLATLKKSSVTDGYIYCQVSRGTAPRCHTFPKTQVAANELVYVQGFDEDPYGSYREIGIKVITYPDIRWQRRDIKTVNLLGNCLAKQEAEEKGCQEAIFIESDGTITEASQNNVFMISQGCLFTRPLSAQILPGITRAFVLGLAKAAGLSIRESNYSHKDLLASDEVFVCGTFTEVLPVIKIDDHVVQSGKPGIISLSLFRAYRDKVSFFLKSQI